jgi:hypothetical protein
MAIVGGFEIVRGADKAAAVGDFDKRKDRKAARQWMESIHLEVAEPGMDKQLAVVAAEVAAAVGGAVGGDAAKEFGMEESRLRAKNADGGE